MYAWLRAELLHQPASVYLDYLDIYRVARATFSENHLLDLDPWDEPLMD